MKDNQSFDLLNHIQIKWSSLQTGFLLIGKIFLIILLISSSGCQSNDAGSKIQDMSFATSTYYPSFLFVGERNDTTAKILKFGFNKWAIQENSKVRLGVFDETNNLIDSNSDLALFVNEKPVTSGIIDLDSQADSNGQLKISLLFSPNTQTTKHHGLIKVIHSDLDRINNIEDVMGSPVLSWTATQKVVWNPLKKYLFIVLCFLLTLLLFWLVILRPIVYRRFGKTALVIQSPQFKNLRLSKAIGLTLTNHTIKQSWKNRLFKGKELTYSNPLFTEPILVTPHSRNKARIRLGSNYTIVPYTTTLNKGAGAYKITNSTTKQIITITYG